MISLDHLLVAPEVFNARFSCDVDKCKGACCTMPGGAGAPITVDEIKSLTDNYKRIAPYLTKTSKNHIEKYGMAEEARGSFYTNCIKGADCVFVVYEKGVAACGIEKAWHDGKSDFRKPISCHLFPIRVANLGGPYLHYQEFDECRVGRELGERENILLVDSVHDALVRQYGKDIANKFSELAKKETELNAL